MGAGWAITIHVVLYHFVIRFVFGKIVFVVVKRVISAIPKAQLANAIVLALEITQLGPQVFFVVVIFVVFILTVRPREAIITNARISFATIEMSRKQYEFGSVMN